MLLQAGAIIHFIRRRPDTYWLYIILFLGPVGAIVYLFAEALPDVGLLNQSFKGISRRKRIAALELMIRDNPSAGNYEELGELCMEDGQLQLPARHSTRQSPRAQIRWIASTAGHVRDSAGRCRGSSARSGKGGRKEPNYDFNRAPALLAHAYALTGEKEKADALFRRVTLLSTSSETYLNFADLLASEGRNAEAREWAQKVLDKEPTMPRYLRRRERPWFARARKMLKAGSRRN